MEGTAELSSLFTYVYEARLRSGELRLHDILELGRDVESLTAHPGWGPVMELVQTLRDRRLNELVTAVKPLEQAEYARRLGFVNGLNAALDAAAVVLRAAEEQRRLLEKEAARPAAESR